MLHHIEGSDIRNIIPPREKDSHKGTYGYIALIGGSIRYSGAIRLAYMANAAMRSGAGVVRVGIPKSLVHDLIPQILESTVFPMSDHDGEFTYNEDELRELIRNVRVVAFGMGIGVSDDTVKMLTFLLKEYRGRLIIDADGLTILSGLDRQIIAGAGCDIVLTPHYGEFSRLSGRSIDEISRAPVEEASTYIEKLTRLRFSHREDHEASGRTLSDESPKTVLLLKGSSTVIADGKDIYISDSGCPGMATAGSGDVLSGILAAICAYVPKLTLAVAGAAYINGCAGELAQEEKGAVSMTAGDTVSHIADVIRSLTE